MKNIILSIGLLFATALSTAQNVFQASGERSVLRTELPKYTKIDIDSRWEVTLVNEKNDHIYIDADNAIHPIIKATVEDGTLEIGSCKEGNLQLNCRNLTFNAGSLAKLPISGKVENLNFVSNRIIRLETYDLKIQNAIFNTSGIVKAKLYIDGSIQGKTNGFFELRYKGNAINRIDPSPMVKIIKEEKE